MGRPQNVLNHLNHRYYLPLSKHAPWEPTTNILQQYKNEIQNRSSQITAQISSRQLKK